MLKTKLGKNLEKQFGKLFWKIKSGNNFEKKKLGKNLEKQFWEIIFENKSGNDFEKKVRK